MTGTGRAFVGVAATIVRRQGGRPHGTGPAGSSDGSASYGRLLRGAWRARSVRPDVREAGRAGGCDGDRVERAACSPSRRPVEHRRLPRPAGRAPLNVVGVMAAGFRDPFDGEAEAWKPANWHALGNRYLRAIGRLAVGTSAEAATAELTTLTSGLSSAARRLTGTGRCGRQPARGDRGRRAEGC